MKPKENSSLRKGFLWTAILLFGLAAGYLWNDSRRAASVIQKEIPNADVTRIASEYLCSCGQCSGEELSQCSCDAAKKEREFIRTALESGSTPDDIRLVLSTRHKRVVSDAGEMKKETASPLASIDREVEDILKNYRCGCGKCEGEPLSDCECGHANGGREVKGYLRSRLSDAKVSRPDLIRELEEKFDLQRVL